VRTDGLGDVRVPAVCSDDDLRVLSDGVAVLAVAADPDHAAVVDEEVLEREPLADLCT
jgi:hypothetical protein